MGGAFFPFDGDLRLVRLDEPIVPGPARHGEPGGGECLHCAKPDDHGEAVGAGTG